MSLQDKLATLKAKRNEIILKQGENITTRKSQESASLSSISGKLDLLKERQEVPSQFYVSDSSNNKVRLVVMLDISGSMQGTENDIFEGLSELIYNHKDDDIIVTLVVFNGEIKTIYRDMPIDKVKPYVIHASGNTDLNGALYKTLLSYSGVNDMDTLFITISDGDNNIKEIPESLVVSLLGEISGGKNKFYFLGEADESYMKPEDVRLRANKLGFNDDHITIFTREYSGNRINFSVISYMLDDLLEKGEVRVNWDEPIKENYLRLTNERR